MDSSDINTTDLSSYREAFIKYNEESNQKPRPTSQIVVMVYNNIRNITNGKQVRLIDVLKGIKTDSARKNVAYKGDLSVAYFSATLIKGRKENDNVIQHSGLIIIDIDKGDNPDIDLVQLKKDLIADKYTCACFNSPNGGIKVIVNTDISAIEHHKVYFESIKQYLLTHYNITKIDPSGCNVARACFLPFDSDCYYKSPTLRYCMDINQIEIIHNNILYNNYIHNSSNSLLYLNSISPDEHYDNIKNLLRKWTEVGIYANIFNRYRYKNIERGIMRTDVPFLEFIVLMNTFPNQLDWSTRLDEIYFKDDPQKPISTDTIEGLDGMEVCEIVLPKGHVIKEHFRAKTLGSISMKLIFNNPFCHIDYLIKEVIRINDIYCENPHPKKYPKPDDTEVRKIVWDNYRKFLNGDLDFSKVIRKNRKNELSKKYVFWSRTYKRINSDTTRLEATRTYHEGRNTKNLKLFNEAIQVLQDGKKITQKRIADYLGVSTRTIRRYNTLKFDEIISRYNNNIKVIKRKKAKGEEQY